MLLLCEIAMQPCLHANLHGSICKPGQAGQFACQFAWTSSHAELALQ